MEATTSNDGDYLAQRSRRLDNCSHAVDGGGREAKGEGGGEGGLEMTGGKERGLHQTVRCVVFVLLLFQVVVVYCLLLCCVVVVVVVVVVLY